MLRATPSLVLGASSADPMQEFADVPAAMVLSDSTLVIVNRATHELRFFSPSAEFIKTAGRRGEGPGEFTTIAAFAVLAAESLAVQDWRTSRVSVFTRGGVLARSFTLGPPPQRPRAALVGAFSDGTLLGAGSDWLTDVEPPAGLLTLTQTAFRFTALGAPLAPVGNILEREYLFVAGPSGVSRYVMPYGFFGCIRVHGDSFLMGDGRIFEIREYRQSGALKRIIRADLEPKRIASADKAGEKERILAFYGRKTASSGFERFGLLYLGARPCLRSNDSNSPRMGGCGSNSIGESTKHRAGYSLIPTDARAGSSTSHLGSKFAKFAAMVCSG